MDDKLMGIGGLANLPIVQEQAAMAAWWDGQMHKLVFILKGMGHEHTRQQVEDVCRSIMNRTGMSAVQVILDLFIDIDRLIFELDKADVRP